MDSLSCLEGMVPILTSREEALYPAGKCQSYGSYLYFHLQKRHILPLTDFLEFCVINKLAQSTLCPIILMINEDVKQDWTQYWPLGCTASYRPSTRLHALVSTLLAWSFRQFSANLFICLSSLYIDSFSTRVFGTECQGSYWNSGRQYLQLSFHLPGLSISCRSLLGWSNLTFPLWSHADYSWWYSCP